MLSSSKQYFWIKDTVMSNAGIVAIILVVIIIAVGLLVVLLKGGGISLGSEQANVSSNLRSLVAAQRSQTELGAAGPRKSRESLAMAAAAESQLTRKKLAGSKITLEKRLKYARWPITPLQFRVIQLVVTILVFIPMYLAFGWAIRFTATFMTPLLVDAVLGHAVKRRFNAFDTDYPVLLMSYVSLLKTGMSTIAGLEAAAKGLDSNSLVRGEVELLVERLRVGLTEDQAINAFGEDIAHPELELFVQSLLLSRKVGGTLSATLERLAKQVRKRQQFRKQAVAVVGMEQGSIYAIAVIMTLLMVYLCVSSPELVLPAFSHPTGRSIFESGVSMIIWGFYWSKRVTNIKI
ncbi:MAG: type II secretion system F family protein [Deltaproteobacteria bacterium]|nr:type II secretion system F family protein [Deltaproteobacteria bacterium]